MTKKEILIRHWEANIPTLNLYQRDDSRLWNIWKFYFAEKPIGYTFTDDEILTLQEAVKNGIERLKLMTDIETQTFIPSFFLFEFGDYSVQRIRGGLFRITRSKPDNRGWRQIIRDPATGEEVIWREAS